MEIHTGEVSEPCSGVSGRLVSGIGQYVSVSVIPVLFLKSSTKKTLFGAQTDFARKLR